MQATHPDEQTLKAYGLGKLDDGPATTVNDHLETCEECRQKLSGLTSDSFLGKFRDARQPMGRSMFGGSLVDGTASFLQPKATVAPPATDTIPPGLSHHPDYEIRRELGRGGMGVVYLAHNTMMGRDEVLKVMGRQIMERPGVLERFQREIRAVAKLRHPNIVAAYHAFRIEGGLVFSMEYVEGLDLARLVKAKGPLSVSHASYFVHQAALGLQHAHERGLIHRDIKPHNLMLTHDGKARLVKVLDFGLAKATREEKIDGGLTSEGQALGTPDYIAPEQITNAPDVDIRADLYSLGGTLFYLLTGRPPFQANSLYDIYQAHMSRDVEPLNLIRPEIPAELAALVSKMMAKEPKRRFQTPDEVAGALAPFFRKSHSPTKSKGEVSQPVAQPAPRRAADSGRAMDGGAATPAKRRAPGREAAAPLEGKEVWESLILDRTPESLKPQIGAATTGQRPPWSLKAKVAAAMLFVMVALGVIIVTIKRRDGSELKLTIENTPSVKSMTGPNPGDPPRPNPEVAPSAPARNPFVPLFNGKDLQGWTDTLVNGSRWQVVEGGLLQGSGASQWGNPAALVTDRRDFRNFRLRCKFRLIRGNFGWIEVRSKSKASTTSGYFVALGSLWDKSGSIGSLSWATGYVYGADHDWKNRSDFPAPEPNVWYTFETSVIGNHITASVDGAKIQDFTDVKDRFQAGAIVLGCGSTGTIQFQEVMVEILPDDSRPSGSNVIQSGAASSRDSNLGMSRPLPQADEVPGTVAAPKSDLDRVATGRWVQLVDSETVVSDPLAMKLDGGILEVNSTSMEFPQIQARDIILRAKVRKLTGQNVNMGVRGGDLRSYQAWFNGAADGGDLFGLGQRANPYRNLASSHIGRGINPNQFVEMALAAIGDTLTLYVNGAKVASAKLDEVEGGFVRLGSFKGKSVFKDVEYQILDPVPLAEGS